MNKMHFLRNIVYTLNPHIILVTETWINDLTHQSSYHITGYKSHVTGRHNCRGGGCIIYTEETLSTCPVSDPLLDSLPDSCWITAEVNTHSLLLGCIYFPPHSNISDLSNLTDAFHLVSTHPANYKLVAGDFNMREVDWLQGTSPHKLQQFVSTITTLGWSQHVLSPTRKDSVLDLIFTLGISAESASIIDCLPGSDHNMVTLSLLLPARNDKSQSRATYHRPYSKVNWATFAILLRSADWDSFFLSRDPEEATEILYANFGNCVDALAPLELNVRSGHEKGISTDKPLQRKLSKLANAYQKTHDIAILFQLHNLSAKIELKRSEKLHAEELRALSGTNKIKDLVQLLNRRGHRDKNITSISLSPSSSTDDPSVICDLFNQHFCSSFNVSGSAQPSTSDIPLTSDTLNSIEFSESEIKKFMTPVKASYWEGPDGIPTTLIKQGGTDIPLLLLNLFNLSMQSSHVPSHWKHAIVIPHHKKGPKDKLANYRPISHTSILLKIMEKIVKDQTSDFLLSRNLISKSQHGFIKRRSCQSCLLELLNNITNSVDNGKAYIIVFLDMRKAFDQVPHDRLLTVLSKHGIQNPLLSWFKSYLDGRTQAVQIGSQLSSRRPVTSGVIQGSVLGPLLFLIYINDVVDALKHGSPYLFADDIKVAYSFDRADLNATLLNVQADLDALGRWCSATKMSFSADKSFVMTHKCDLQTHPLTIEGVPLTHGNQIRDLGLHYSNTLNFSEHAQFTVAKAKKVNYMLHRLFDSTKAKVILYKTCTRPIMEYCSMVYSNANHSNTQELERVQRSFTRHILGPASGLNYSSRCQVLSLDPVWLRRLKINLSLLYDIIHGRIHSPGFAPKLRQPTKYDIRNTQLTIRVQKSRTSLRSNFFLNRYANIWNKLPLSLRTCTSPYVFRRKVNEFLTVAKASVILCHNLPLNEAYQKGPIGI